ncbi:MAG: hypothetical protein PHS44_04245 [Candidatus Dojkabacteria bacterium]|nr:hypothetical protein [Candidatus Dojkabacteria bacterium]
MNKVKIIDSNDTELIKRLADKFDADLYNIDKITRAWIAKDNKTGGYKGILGVCKWDRKYGIIDLFAPRGKDSPEEIMESLVKNLVEVAKEEEIKSMYCHIGDKSIHLYLRNGFKYIRENKMPKGYICVCNLCPEMNKTCFPKPIMWENGTI